MDGTSIFCDCCKDQRHREKLGELGPYQGLHIRDRRHGQHHIVFLEPRELLERLVGTCDASAAHQFVETIFG